MKSNNFQCYQILRKTKKIYKLWWNANKNCLLDLKGKFSKLCYAYSSDAVRMRNHSLRFYCAQMQILLPYIAFGCKCKQGT